MIFDLANENWCVWGKIETSDENENIINYNLEQNQLNISEIFRLNPKILKVNTFSLLYILTFLFFIFYNFSLNKIKKLD